MKKVQAYKGLDGKVYDTEEGAMEADEAFVVAGMVKDLETLYARESKIGSPTKVFSTLRGEVKKIFETWEKKAEE